MCEVKKKKNTANHDLFLMPYAFFGFSINNRFTSSCEKPRLRRAGNNSLKMAENPLKFPPFSSPGEYQPARAAFKLPWRLPLWV